MAVIHLASIGFGPLTPCKFLPLLRQKWAINLGRKRSGIPRQADNASPHI
jgi:hypothetical protein